ncbi:hypothetical protein [Kordiimonas sp.]|uniref:hypothetical protein n=1 Tax=Kordiimonas sp. TaxID=1970157 RepID=UPI003A8DF4C7
MNDSDYIENIRNFLNSIGIQVVYKQLPDDTFLPGLRIEYGQLAVDIDKLKYPGDMLHEAGHIATMAPTLRKTTFADAGTDMGEEIASQAWSYAAALACNVPPEVVFHEHGYKGAAQWLKEHYEGEQCFAGLPLLAWYGLSGAPGCGDNGLARFPMMSAWLRAHDDPSMAH